MQRSPKAHRRETYRVVAAVINVETHELVATFATVEIAESTAQKFFANATSEMQPIRKARTP